MDHDSPGHGSRSRPGHIVLERNPALPIFGQCPLWPNDEWIKMPLGTEVGLGPCDIVLDGDPVGGTAAPIFWPMYCGETAAWINIPLGMDV